MKIVHVLATAALITMSACGLEPGNESVEHTSSALSVQGTTLFGGRNIYAPTVIYDDQEHLYTMWYGGWQTDADYPNDRIFYRTSTDSVTWSDGAMVVSPKDAAHPGGVHVNDPSVTKTYNALVNVWQYTMFYTYCYGGCSDAESEIWSTVSTDGVHWSLHQPVLKAGATNPSVIYEPSANGTIWKLYYINRVEGAREVKMAQVSGYRTPIGVPISVFRPASTTIGDVEVRNIGGVWNLFYNKMGFTNVDVYLAKSSSNTSFTTGAPFIATGGSTVFCAALTPGILPLANGTYKFFFSLTEMPLTAGQCDLSNRTRAMQLWDVTP